MLLSKRLRAAADLVRKNCIAADVGCDHGLLCAHLITAGTAEYAYAVDIAELPLAKARELFSRLGIGDQVSVLCADGLDGVPDRVTDVVIAGLGAEMTLGIISRAPMLRNPEKRLVLVPATRHAELRRGLAAAGFRTTDELAVCESGHCYCVIAAEYDGNPRQLSELQQQLGSITADTPDGKKYLENTAQRLEKQLAGLERASAPDYDQIQRLKILIKQIRERIFDYD